MKTRRWKLEDGRSSTRSVLECGGWQGAGLTPLSELAASELKRWRRSALLAHSTTCRLWLVCFCFLLSAFCFRALGQYSVDWSTIDGGGGTSTGGVYSVTGTIGQPDAGKMSGGNFTLDGGFWGLVAAVQTPGAPWLTITLNPQPSTITVSWPLSETSWQLQATTNLVTTGRIWTECSYQTNGATCYRIESPPAGNKFYRLKKP
jgi:hypothetical protein